jgi:hypothetical protein
MVTSDPAPQPDGPDPSDPRRQALVDSLRSRYSSAAAQNDAEAKQALVADYLRALAKGSMSFPLGEAGGHLYTRVGTHSFDFVRSVNGEPYSYRGSRRLEAIVALQPVEQARLLEYLKNMRQSTLGVGVFSMDGARSGNTRGSLRDNTTTNSIFYNYEGHNCTSWICTAPIGEQGQPLLSLAGATPAEEVHTNPGWWSQYLTGAAPPERVPAVAYWSGDDESLTQVLGRVRRGTQFPYWNFAAH